MRPRTLEIFDLNHEPFSKELDDEQLWLPPSKKDAVDTLVQDIKDRKHILMSGEPGAGKTVVLRAVRHALPQTRFRLTYCHNATLGRRDFYRQLCLTIGLTPKATAASMFNALSEYVQQLSVDAKQHPVFLIDECHLMRDEMLDHLHILQNFSWDSRAILSLVLIGLPELEERLRRRRHRSLMSRIYRRVSISPLVPEDTGGYIRYRFKQAGSSREPFPPDAIAVLHEKTGGLMRDIDRIASLCLELAERRKLQTIHKDIVLDAINVDMNGVF